MTASATSSGWRNSILKLCALSAFIPACTPPVDLEHACENAGRSAEARAAQSDARANRAVAVFGRSRGGWFLCTGVLVGPRTVLTAAHCVHNRDDWVIDVYFATDLLSPDPFPIRVGSRREHPTRDLAALVLDQTGPVDAQLLRWSADLLGARHKDRLSITGYGGPNGDPSQCLRVAVKVKDLSLDPLRSDSTRYAVLLDGRSFRGDSGGPLILDDTDGPILLGIHHGSTTGDVSYGSLSTVERLPSDDQWVREVVQTSPIQIR